MLDWWKVGEVQSTKIIRGESTKYQHDPWRKYKVQTLFVKNEPLSFEWLTKRTKKETARRTPRRALKEGISDNERQLTVKGTAASRLMATKTATKLEPTNQTELNEPSRTISTTLTQNHLKQANLVAPVKRRMYEGDVCNEVRKRASKVQKGNHFQLTYLNSYPISKPNWNRCQRWSRRRRI